MWGHAGKVNLDSKVLDTGVVINVKDVCPSFDEGTALCDFFGGEIVRAKFDLVVRLFCIIIRYVSSWQDRHPAR